MAEYLPRVHKALCSAPNTRSQKGHSEVLPSCLNDTVRSWFAQASLSLPVSLSHVWALVLLERLLFA